MTAASLTSQSPAATTGVVPSDEPSVVVSIVVPCLNEQLVVGEFVDWAKEGIAKAGVSGEVMIVDSSTDRSPEIAEERGARVLRVPKRGLGQAYLDAIPHIRGKYVIMGDADLTYDFREIKQFVERLDEGYDFVMGTRMNGYIEPGAMPALHRYFGTPLTTFILNFIYGTRYSDIHCGMRGMTLDALKRMRLQSTSWEYASEMVLKAALLKLRTTDVPIKFYKDREGRTSHHVRSGWFSPWKAGWINLKAMFVFAPHFFLFWPSIVLLTLGLALTIGLSTGPRSIGNIGFNLHWMLLGVTFATLGYSGLQLALLSKVYYGYAPKVSARVYKVFGYDQGMIAGIGLMTVGVLMNVGLLAHWYLRGFGGLDRISHGAVFGLLLIILGFQTMTYTLILHMVRHFRRGETAS